jgi:hypothetical protein
MLFLGMINGGNKMLLLAGVGGLINGRDMTLLSLGWSTVWLVMCNGKSACVGRLTIGGNMMLFLGMINGGNTMLLLAGAGGLIDSRDTTLLLSASRRFGYLCVCVYVPGLQLRMSYCNA